MDRRRFLGLLIAGVVPFGGCTSVGESPSEPQTATTTVQKTTQPETSTVDSATEGQSVVDPAHFPMYEPPEQTERIGSREGIDQPDLTRPHDLLVWNAASKSRTISVTVDRRTDGTATENFDDDVTIPADSLLRVRLRAPANYSISVGVAGTDQSESFSVSRDRFDCNESHTQITVHPSELITTELYTEQAGCPNDTVAG